MVMTLLNIYSYYPQLFVHYTRYSFKLNMSKRFHYDLVIDKNNKETYK